MDCRRGPGSITLQSLGDLSGPGECQHRSGGSPQERSSVHRRTPVSNRKVSSELNPQRSQALWTIPEFDRTGEIGTPSASLADLQYPRRLGTQVLWKIGKLDCYSDLGSLELQWYGRPEKAYRLGAGYVLQKKTAA